MYGYMPRIQEHYMEYRNITPSDEQTILCPDHNLITHCKRYPWTLRKNVCFLSKLAWKYPVCVYVHSCTDAWDVWFIYGEGINPEQGGSTSLSVPAQPTQQSLGKKKDSQRGILLFLYRLVWRAHLAYLSPDQEGEERRSHAGWLSFGLASSFFLAELWSCWEKEVPGVYWIF